MLYPWALRRPNNPTARVLSLNTRNLRPSSGRANRCCIPYGFHRPPIRMAQLTEMGLNGAIAAKAQPILLVLRGPGASAIAGSLGKRGG